MDYGPDNPSLSSGALSMSRMSDTSVSPETAEIARVVRRFLFIFVGLLAGLLVDFVFAGSRAARAGRLP